MNIIQTMMKGQFLFRCKPSFNNMVRGFVASGEKDIVTTFIPKQDQSFKNKNHAIQQDFNCALVISNIQTLLIEEAQMKLDETQPGKKYDYKIN